MRCGRSALARLADWSDDSCIAGTEVPRENGFDYLLTGYDRVLLQFGMHISWDVPDDSERSTVSTTAIKDGRLR